MSSVQLAGLGFLTQFQDEGDTASVPKILHSAFFEYQSIFVGLHFMSSVRPARVFKLSSWTGEILPLSQKYFPAHFLNINQSFSDWFFCRPSIRRGFYSSLPGQNKVIILKFKK